MLLILYIMWKRITIGIFRASYLTDCPLLCLQLPYTTTALSMGVTQMDEYSSSTRPPPPQGEATNDKPFSFYFLSFLSVICIITSAAMVSISLRYYPSLRVHFEYEEHYLKCERSGCPLFACIGRLSSCQGDFD